MDVDLRRLAVGVVGFSMAVVGFFLSITVPIVTTIVPQLQRQVPEGAHGRLRKRIQPRASRELRLQDSLPAAPQTVASGSGSAASLESSCTVPTMSSSSHHATCTLASSLSNSPECPSHGLPSASPVPHRKREPGCSTVVQHICTPQKCSNRATTSASAAQENAGKSANDKGVDRDNARESIARPPRAVSWLKASPPSSLLHLQLTPRSSGESSRVPALVLPSRASTFDQDSLGAYSQGRPEPRRASTLFGFRRTSKVPARAGSDPAPAPLTSPTVNPMQMPVDEGRRSEPASPSPALHDLHDMASDAENTVQSRKRRLSYFSRLKRKHKGRDTANATQLHSEAEQEPDVSANSPSQRNERGRERHARRLCDRRRKTAAAQTAPPRTRPYEAPYYFPSPVSPEAVDYVERTRSEYRRTSVSPSFAARTPYHNEPGVISPALAATPGSGPARQATSNPPLSRSSVPVPQSAPAHTLNFAPGRHRKSASTSTSGPTTSHAADEFGFVLYPPAPVSSQTKPSGSSRENRPVLNRASPTA